MAFVKYWDPTEPAGGDGSLANPYQSFSELEAAEATDLDVLGDFFQARRLGVAVDTDSPDTISGSWTTSATNYLEIMSDDGLYKRWDPVTAGVHHFRITGQNAQHVRIKGFDFRANQGGSGRDILQFNNNTITSDFRVDGCIFSGVTSSRAGIRIYDNGGVLKVSNSIFHNNVNRGVRDETVGAGHVAHYRYCVFYNNSSHNISAAAGNVSTVINCYAQNYNSNLGTLTNSASEDATGDPVSLQNIAASTTSGAYFLNLTPGSEDFHTDPLNSALEDVGIDVSSDPDFPVSFDAEGVARHATTPDIGAYENVAAGNDYTITPDISYVLVDSSSTHESYDIAPGVSYDLNDASSSFVSYGILPSIVYELTDNSSTGGEYGIVPDFSYNLLDSSSAHEFYNITSDVSYDLNDASSSFVSYGILPSIIYELVDNSSTEGEYGIIPDVSFDLFDSSATTQDFLIVPGVGYVLSDDSVGFESYGFVPDISYLLTDFSTGTEETITDFKITPDIAYSLNDVSDSFEDYRVIPSIEYLLINNSYSGSGYSITPNLSYNLNDVSSTLLGFRIIPDAVYFLADSSVSSEDYYRVPDTQYLLIDNSFASEDPFAGLIVSNERDLDNVILNRLRMNWDVVANDFPIYAENEEYFFKDRFGRIYIKRSNTVPRGISGNQVMIDRHVGFIQININTPLGMGTSDSLVLAQDLADIFQHKQFNGVICQEATIQTFEVPSGDRYPTVVTIPYYWTKHTQGELVQ